MQVLQIVSPGAFEIVDVPTPEPGPDEVLVKVQAVSTCPHWDIHMMDGEPMFPGQKLTYPLTPGQPGHEMVGEVVQTGARVDGFPIGSTVAAWQDRGGGVSQGCYGQYVAFRSASLMVVDPDLLPEAVAPLELSMCVQVTLDQLISLQAIEGKRVGMSGLGPAGLVAVQMALAYGAREIIGIDPNEARRQMASDLGASVVYDPSDSSLPPGRFSDSALDTGIDCTGLRQSIEYLIARCRTAVAVFGVMREAVTFPSDCWRGGFSLLGYGSHNRGAAERAYSLISGGQLDLSPLITTRLPLSKYPEGVALLKSQTAIKVLFDPWN